MLLLSTFDLYILYVLDCNQEKDFARESARVSPYRSHINILNSQRMNIGYIAIILFWFRQNTSLMSGCIEAGLTLSRLGTVISIFCINLFYTLMVLTCCLYVIGLSLVPGALWQFFVYVFVVIFWVISLGSGQIAINMAQSVIFKSGNSGTNVCNNLIFNFITIHYYYKL